MTTRRPLPLLLIWLALGTAGTAGGAVRSPQLVAGGDRLGGGAPAATAKAAGDSVLLMGPWGSGAPFNGQFQTSDGAADWNGWTHRDFTVAEEQHWHASAYQVVSGAYSAYCGDPSLTACGPADAAGGYGNNWRDALQWSGPVADPAAPCTVTLHAVLNHDLEPGYDFLFVECLLPDGGVQRLATFDGKAAGVVLDESFTYQPGEYRDGDQVGVRFLVSTDGSFSDEDCDYPSIGAVQLDDVVIGLSNGLSAGHDFEDGTLGPFISPAALGVGDFAKIWTGLRDSDPCASNFSPQVAFIDDGVVVPGTGGSFCIDHCYGPGGHVVNSTGGLAGPQEHLDNGIISPVMPRPAGYENLLLEFTVFEDDYLFFVNDDPGILYTWYLRSTAAADPAGIEDAAWTNSFAFYINDIFDGRYYRQAFEIGSRLVPDARFFQVRLNATEFGFVYDENGNNALPAPYFDNVRVTAHNAAVPLVETSPRNLAQDAFPESRSADMGAPATLSARFDTPVNEEFTAAGDSVAVTIAPGRSGAALARAPRLVYRLQANPVFDPYRSSGLPDAGWVEGWEAPLQLLPPQQRFAFDLPDTGFLFPGDVLHYYIEAVDERDGEQRIALLPADTSGFDSFASGSAYDPLFTVRVLPTITEAPGSPGSFRQPDLLLWDDSIGDAAESPLWIATLAQLGLHAGLDYDLVTRPAIEQGMAPRTALPLLAAYDDLIYVAGLGTGSFLPDEDLQLLESWFALGGRDLLALGTALPGHLHDIYGWSGSGIGAAFASARLGIAAAERDVRPLIDGQDFPRVLPSAGNPVLGGVSSWRDNGRCRSGGGRYMTFVNANAVTPEPTAVPLAEFADPEGQAGAYSVVAGLLNEVAADQSRAVTLPTILSRITSEPAAAKADAPLAARARLLGDILGYFGRTLDGQAATPVPAAGAFLVQAYPNPFNPATTIAYSLPRSGRLNIRLFDVRGRLVRQLVDERREAGSGSAAWDGRDETGAAAPSGIYFYEARTAGEVRVGKVTLLK